MTIAATSTVVDHTSDAGFRTWVAEIVTMLFTTLGVTQTTDTGQINTTTVTRPAINTMGGYVIGEFNDTLNSTAPIFFKLQFGTGNTAGSPAMQIQIGTGSTGAGVLNGVTGVNVAITPNANTPTSTTTPYVTRACYNTSDGVLWLAWKLNGQSVTNVTLGGFLIARSNDNTGAPTADSTLLLSNSATSTGSTTSGFCQFISHLSGASYSTSPFPSSNWCMWPFSVTGTLFGGNTEVSPCFQYTPVIGVSNWYGLAFCGEIAVGSTTPAMALVGSTTHTYIAAGSIMGTTNFGLNTLPANGGGATSSTLLLPWE